MEHDLARLCHAYQHRNLRNYELCKSEFLDSEVLHKHKTTSPGKKG